jgi:hypothetical protein
MKTERTNGLKSNCRAIALAAITALALLAVLPNNASAAKPYIFNINDTFEDPDSFCVPVQIHIEGRIIEQILSGGQALTLVESLKLEFTNLDTGKTITTRTAVRIKDSYVGEWGLIEEIEGVVLVPQARGAWVQAGLTITMVFDPVTGEDLFLTVKIAGKQGGDFNDAICTALQ